MCQKKAVLPRGGGLGVGLGVLRLGGVLDFRWEGSVVRGQASEWMGIVWAECHLMGIEAGHLPSSGGKKTDQAVASWRERDTEREEKPAEWNHTTPEVLKKSAHQMKDGE